MDNSKILESVELFNFSEEKFIVDLHNFSLAKPSVQKEMLITARNYILKKCQSESISFIFKSGCLPSIVKAATSEGSDVRMKIEAISLISTIAILSSKNDIVQKLAIEKCLVGLGNLMLSRNKQIVIQSLDALDELVLGAFDNSKQIIPSLSSFSSSSSYSSIPIILSSSPFILFQLSSLLSDQDGETLSKRKALSIGALLIAPGDLNSNFKEDKRKKKNQSLSKVSLLSSSSSSPSSLSFSSSCFPSSSSSSSAINAFLHSVSSLVNNSKENPALRFMAEGIFLNLNKYGKKEEEGEGEGEEVEKRIKKKTEEKESEDTEISMSFINHSRKKKKGDLQMISISDNPFSSQKKAVIPGNVNFKGGKNLIQRGNYRSTLIFNNLLKEGIFRLEFKITKIDEKDCGMKMGCVSASLTPWQDQWFLDHKGGASCFRSWLKSGDVVVSSKCSVDIDNISVSNGMGRPFSLRRNLNKVVSMEVDLREKKKTLSFSMDNNPAPAYVVNVPTYIFFVIELRSHISLDFLSLSKAKAPAIRLKEKKMTWGGI